MLPFETGRDDRAAHAGKNARRLGQPRSDPGGFIQTTDTLATRPPQHTANQTKKSSGLAAQLLGHAERDPFVACFHSLRQVHFPGAVRAVHLHFDGGAGGRMVVRGLDEEKIRPHLLDAEAHSIQEQPHPHQRGVSAVGAGGFMSREPEPIARRYASRNRLSVEFPGLGGGIHGQVFFVRGSAAPGGTAIKVFYLEEFFRRELLVYERLREAGVRTIRGLSVPQLIRADGGLLVLEMTVVERPYRMDFAGAFLDDDAPQFDDEVDVVVLVADGDAPLAGLKTEPGAELEQEGLKMIQQGRLQLLFGVMCLLGEAGELKDIRVADEVSDE